MKKAILKHLNVNGFVKGEDLTNCEILERKLDVAKNKLKLAKKEASKAKFELNSALEESLNKIDNERKKVENIKKNEKGESMFASMFITEQMKTKYEETVVELELKKNEIRKKIEEYKEDGSEKWDSFKHKLNHDLEELGKALKGFAMHAN